MRNLNVFFFITVAFLQIPMSVIKIMYFHLFAIEIAKIAALGLMEKKRCNITWAFQINNTSLY